MAENSSDRPPLVIFNTDGNWVFNYLPGRNGDDVTRMLEQLAEAGVGGLSVLVGIDDDLSWRGSGHGQLWGDNVENWDPDGDPSRPSFGGSDMSGVANLHQCLAAIIEDGHELMNIYIDGARKHGVAAYGSFRMNDAHTCMEDRGWYGRSKQKIERPDLLIGSGVSDRGHGEEWKFSWQWDYAQEEVRRRFLGLFDETLTRYDFDGLELDFCRQPPFFRSGQAVKNITTMTDFMRQVRAVVGGHSRAKDKDIKLIVRVPPSIDETLGLGIDTQAWIREGLADIVVLASVSLCTSRIDVARAVDCAKGGEVLIYTGFDGGTHLTSPQDGYESGPSSVLCAVGLNGYKHGAGGVHLFNYDYKGHRAGPTEGEGYNEDHLRTLHDLGDPGALERRNRCYAVTDSHIGNNPGYALGDHRPEVPRKLALIGRGAGPAHAMQLTIEDDITAGLAEGRIKTVELRVRMTNHENSMDRMRCLINDRPFDFKPCGTVKNRWGDTWMVFDNPPIRCGVNTVLLVLDGIKTPDPWPTVHQCEVVVKCEDGG